jgi:hypothetical protein
MSRTARDLARRLAEAEVDAAALAVLVNDMAAARAAAINADGLQAQIGYLLESYGAAEIEHLALGGRPRGDRR